MRGGGATAQVPRSPAYFKFPPPAADASSMKDHPTRSGPRRPTAAALLVLACLPFLLALRPFESTDGSTPPPGALMLEWGAASLHLAQPRTYLIAPHVVARLGVTDHLEAAVLGHYRMEMLPGQAPWDGHAAAGDFGFYGKWVLFAGAMQTRLWSRPSIAVQAGAEFLTVTSRWALNSRLAGSLWIGPVMAHISLGYRHDDAPRVFFGAAAGWPLGHGLTPVFEASGEVRYGMASAASLLLGLTEDVPGFPLQFDLSVRRGLASGSPDWTVSAGATLRLQLWRPAPRR